jgi:hypothetical protein
MVERGGCAWDSSGSGQGLVAGSCGHLNELRGSIKRGEFLNYLQTYQPYKKDSAVGS